MYDMYVDIRICPCLNVTVQDQKMSSRTVYYTYSRTGFLGESNTAPLLGRVLRHNPIGLNLADGFSKFSQRAKVDWRKWQRKIRSSSSPTLCPKGEDGPHLFVKQCP